MSNPYNLRVIAEFRAGGGVVGGDFTGTRLLLLTTRGARTGLTRTTPLVYLPDGDRLVVFALNGGAPVAPAWYHNLLAHPEDVVVEVGAETFPARFAEIVDEAEYEELWRRQIEIEPKFAGFRERAGRRVPLVALGRADRAEA
ncbi:nitroreductase/quinone reductase family protein [Allostreptomyces psammosilenae]|uniref:Deazaflavin-dependent oxidoreductase (Nitroreductase family) n=1 Tax=Allostreptomyces psammosilenae TaxID=1892865 RepID=A0A852ZXS4_9ACTN|nr:nitroreductase/quinone reductase family protein [Allostreptomyces psammosilenae]NYI05524.1 deazaflavin-dependent oxidoreductase (nitroreductase family) [Allostreptomyces psammosilenae]